MDDSKKINIKINPAIIENMEASKKLLDSDPELHKAYEQFLFKQKIAPIIAECTKYQEIIVALNRVNALNTHPQVMVEYANKAEEVSEQFRKCIEDASSEGLIDGKAYDEFYTLYRVFQVGIMLIKLFDKKQENTDGSENENQN